MKALLLCQDSGLALSVLRCLADSGVQCHVFGQGEKWDVALSRHCRRFTSCNIDQTDSPPEEFIHQLNAYCSKYQINVIIPADYAATLRLTQIKDKVSSSVHVFPVADISALKILNDKFLFEQFLKKNHLPSPRTVLIETADQFKAVNFDFPRIVKPLHGTGGTVQAYKKSNMEEYLACLKEGRFPYIVQEYIPGEDIDLSVLAYKGRVVAWAIQRWSSPKTLQFMEYPPLLELGKKLIALLNFDGVAHFDARIDERDGAVKFIECNPRFWRSLRGSLWNGVNFVDLGIRLAGGEDVPDVNISKGITYVQPAKVLRQLWRGHFGILKELPESTRKDIGQIMSDPLSCVVSSTRSLTER